MIDKNEALPGFARRKATGPQFGVLPKGFVSVKEVDRENRVVRAVTSTQQVDRHGDIIMQRGWRLETYRSMPRFLLNHDFDGQPLGKSIHEEVVLDSGTPMMVQHLEFAPADISPLAETYLRFYAGKFLDSFSVGFNPINVDPVTDPEKRSSLGLGRFGVVYLDSELLETSSVVIPANPGANQLSAFAGMLKSGDIGSDEMDLLAVRGQLRPSMIKTWTETRGRTYYLPSVAEARHLEEGWEDEEDDAADPEQADGTDEPMAQEPTAMALLLNAVEGLQSSHKRLEDKVTAIQKGIDGERRRYMTVTGGVPGHQAEESPDGEDEVDSLLKSIMSDVSGF